MNAIRIVLLTLSLGLALPAQAIPSTAMGAISVAQIVDLIQRSPKDNEARNAAMAYLAGVGETAGLLVAEARRRSTVGVTCARPLGISSNAALAALVRADKRTWHKAAATPILVEDMLSRAGCR